MCWHFCIALTPYISRLERRGQISSLFIADCRRRSTPCSNSFLVSSGARSARRVAVSGEIRFRHVLHVHLDRCRSLTLAASARQQRARLGRSGSCAHALGARCWQWSSALGYPPALLRCFAEHCMFTHFGTSLSGRASARWFLQPSVFRSLKRRSSAESSSVFYSGLSKTAIDRTRVWISQQCIS